MKSQLLRILLFSLVAIVLPFSLVSCDSPQETSSSSLENEGVSIRVMSYNILHPDWSSESERVEIKGRDEKVANVFKTYMPDVIGVQEVCEEWHNALEPLIVNTGDYVPVCRRLEDSTYNLTTMFYNPKTVSLIQEFAVPLGTYSDIRVLAGGIFQKDGKFFIVVNTHPATPLGEDSTYAEDIDGIIEQIKELMGDYKDVPIIMTGDYNSPKNLPILYTGYNDITNKIGVKDTRDVAKEVINNYVTCPGLYATPSKYNGMMSTSVIDYIFVTDNVNVETFSVVADEGLETVSDHLPIYADIILK